MISNKQTDRIIHALNAFHIELPSWGFANTGTRFGKFLQPAAATSTAEKFADAGQVHRVTGVCPTIALHVLWDLPNGVADCAASPGAGRGARASPGVDQPQRVSGSELQVRLPGQSRSGDPQGGPGSHSGLRRNSEAPGQPRSLALVRRRVQLPRHAEHPPSPPLVRRGTEGHPRRARRGPAHDGGVQALRARFLPHRYRRLGHGAGALAGRRTQGQSAGRYRPPLSGAEHRADRGLAARHEHARRDSTSTTAAMPTTI